ncbi:hypothetical protein UPYG_G00243590 [Umbra pygmaea]|uniref:WW domain binding protein 1 n=1 Tax=Umbra pygmaea TaxID=75934 RepID=A0ABD0WFT9_UMBPY
MQYHSAGSLPLLGRPRYCPGASSNGGYLCETGHCCGETGCCTYYYELWWFWLLWTVLILFSCCCAYRHRRAKLRVQQQQRQREINLLAYHGATSYTSSMLDLSFLASLKLPSYEEVAAQPSTPPPPYSTVFAAHGGAARYPQPPHHAPGPHPGPSVSAAHSSFSSDNSSSCSCESCCPSSPCSSSLSAPVTYETDTSHASTPSEAPSTMLSDYVTAAVVTEPTQSPPKQTLFSPCVDVYHPGPHTWRSDEEDEEDEVSADESQYRHRRLTGDSGIEVCRCQVELEDEDKDEEEEREDAGGEKRGEAGASSLHDSLDCPARGLGSGEGLTLCNPARGGAPLAEEDSVVIVMETV